MNKLWKRKAAVGLAACLIFSSIPVWPGNGTWGKGKSSWGITAYASSSNAERWDDENTENEADAADETYPTASSSDGEELINDTNDVMLMSLNRDGSGTTAVVGSQEEGAYSSIADVFNDLRNDTGVLTIQLKGDTSDSDTIVFPRDKGIEKIIICGDDNYQIGAATPVSVVANGIPMVFQAGWVDRLVGGGLNEGVPSTDLTITGGDFRNCCGGNLVTESGIDARISGTSKLTIDGADLTDGHYNQIYCGSNVNFYADYDGPNISIKETRLTIKDSTIDVDMISGGSYSKGKGTNAALGRSNVVVEGSHLILGDGLCGSHIFDGNREIHPILTCGSVNMEISDSIVEGDILGASCGTYEGNVDTGSIRIYGKNSNIASIQAGGVYMGVYDIHINDIDVTLDSCTVNGTHWFTEEFSLIGAGCYIGEECDDPDDNLHLNIGSIKYTFLNSVYDETEDEGIEGLLFLPEGYIESEVSVSIDKISLVLSAGTEFIIDGGILNEFSLVPPKGYRFTSASIDGAEIERDEMDTASINNLEGGVEIIASLEEVVLKDQSPLIMESVTGGRIKKTFGEPDFVIDVTGGEDALKLHYSSSNPSVAEIDENGKITMKKPGKTMLTAYKQSVEYNLVSVEAELTVAEPAASLIPEKVPEESGYVLVAKKVTPDIQETIDKQIMIHPEFDEDTIILPMEIQLINVITGDENQDKGATFIIAYPDENMKKNPHNYDISILHIPSSGNPYFVPFELTEQGIRVTVDNFSPFIMGYKYVEPDVEDPNHNDGGNTGNGQSEENDSFGGELNGRWIQDQTGWWYRYDNGTYPSSQWAYLPYGNSYDWYYFNSSGYMADGWLTWNNNQYFLHDQSDRHRGSMYTGWHQILGKWYYFRNETGKMRGALLINGKTPDDYRVDEHGIWIP